MQTLLAWIICLQRTFLATITYKAYAHVARFSLLRAYLMPASLNKITLQILYNGSKI